MNDTYALSKTFTNRSRSISLPEFPPSTSARPPTSSASPQRSGPMWDLGSHQDNVGANGCPPMWCRDPRSRQPSFPMLTMRSEGRPAGCSLAPMIIAAGPFQPMKPGTISDHLTPASKKPLKPLGCCYYSDLSARSTVRENHIRFRAVKPTLPAASRRGTMRERRGGAGPSGASDAEQ